MPDFTTSSLRLTDEDLEEAFEDDLEMVEMEEVGSLFGSQLSNTSADDDGSSMSAGPSRSGVPKRRNLPRVEEENEGPSSPPEASPQKKLRMEVEDVDWGGV